MATVAQVVEALQAVLTTTADALARPTGFVRRRSKLTGAAFAQTLVFGWLADPQASLEALAQTAALRGGRVSPQALAQRFTPAAAALLQQLLHAAVTRVLRADPAVLPILARFPAVTVPDSTTITLPAALAAVWAGGGGGPGAGTAALKARVGWDLRRGGLEWVELQAGRASDRRAASPPAPGVPGSLAPSDLGYFSTAHLAARAAAGGYWLTRLPTGTAVFAPDGTRWDLLARLRADRRDTWEAPVLLGAERRLPGRLLVARVPAAVAAQRRRRLRAAARKKGRRPSAAGLALAGWTLFVTNAPAERLSLAEALVLARARWQIEWLFRLWKSHGQVDAWRSAQPWRILCEVYAKLLAMVVQHWLFLVGCWAYPDRSLAKAASTIRKAAWSLAGALRDPRRLARAIREVRACLAAGCRINKSRRAPHTYQLLLALDGPPAAQAA